MWKPNGNSVINRSKVSILDQYFAFKPVRFRQTFTRLDHFLTLKTFFAKIKKKNYESWFPEIGYFFLNMIQVFFSHNFKSQVFFEKFIQNVNFSFFDLDFM